MTTLIIREDSPEARKFLEFAKTLPFVEEKEEKKQTFAEAVAECNGRPVSEFITEVKVAAKEVFGS